jgi:hypothetical protein
MLNEARYEQAQYRVIEHPYMETNQWLAPFLPTRSLRSALVSESETIDVLGVKLIWTKDANRPFPTPVATAIESLYDFAALSENWNSYGGRSLASAAILPAMQLVILGYQAAHVPRLHPLPDGGVGLTWTQDATELEMAVSGNGRVEGLLSDADGNEIELAPGSSIDEAIRLLEQYFAAG